MPRKAPDAPVQAPRPTVATDPKPQAINRWVNEGGAMVDEPHVPPARDIPKPEKPRKSE